MRSSFVALLLVSATTLSALWDGCGGSWGGEIEALYWRPTNCPIPFAVGKGTSDFQRVQDFLIKGDYDWGVRGGVGYSKDCFLATLSYLYLQTTDGATQRRGDFDSFQIQGQADDVDRAKTSLKFRYQNVDFKLHQMLHKCGGCAFSVVGLARWVNIDMKNHTSGPFTQGSASDTANETITIVRSFDQSAKFDGGGVGIGFAGDYCLPCDLRLGGRFDFSAIIGRKKIGGQAGRNTGDFERIVRPADGVTGIVPNGQFALFFSYARCACSAFWKLEVGYELHYFWDALRYAATDRGVNGLPLIDCYDVGFGGPYIGLSGSF